MVGGRCSGFLNKDNNNYCIASHDLDRQHYSLRTNLIISFFNLKI